MRKYFPDGEASSHGMVTTGKKQGLCVEQQEIQFDGRTVFAKGSGRWCNLSDGLGVNHGRRSRQAKKLGFVAILQKYGHGDPPKQECIDRAQFRRWRGAQRAGAAERILQVGRPARRIRQESTQKSREWGWREQAWQQGWEEGGKCVHEAGQVNSAPRQGSWRWAKGRILSLLLFPQARVPSSWDSVTCVPPKNSERGWGEELKSQSDRNQRFWNSSVEFPGSLSPPCREVGRGPLNFLQKSGWKEPFSQAPFFFLFLIITVIRPGALWWKEHELWNQTWVPVPASCVTLGKLLNLSELWLPLK